MCLRNDFANTDAYLQTELLFVTKNESTGLCPDRTCNYFSNLGK